MTSNRSILVLLLLSAPPLMACASGVQTEIAPIPVSQALRDGCEEAVQPADPLTPTALATFGNDAAAEAKCWKSLALQALRTMDEHNARAEPES